jgi:hypothetical protein
MSGNVGADIWHLCNIGSMKRARTTAAKPTQPCVLFDSALVTYGAIVPSASEIGAASRHHWTEMCEAASSSAECPTARPLKAQTHSNVHRSLTRATCSLTVGGAATSSGFGRNRSRCHRPQSAVNCRQQNGAETVYRLLPVGSPTEPMHADTARAEQVGSREVGRQYLNQRSLLSSLAPGRAGGWHWIWRTVDRFEGGLSIDPYAPRCRASKPTAR